MTYTPEPEHKPEPESVESPENVRATQIANEFTRFASEIARATRLATAFATKVATKVATQVAAHTESPSEPLLPPPAPTRVRTVIGEPVPKAPTKATRAKTVAATPTRAKTSFAEPVEEFFDEPEALEPEPDPEPEPELPINTTPTLLERSLALAEVGAEWVGALTQVAVQKAAQDIDLALARERALKKERDERQYHLVAVKGKVSGEYLYVSGAEADEIEKRLGKEGWHVLRTPIA